MLGFAAGMAAVDSMNAVGKEELPFFATVSDNTTFATVSDNTTFATVSDNTTFATVHDYGVFSKKECSGVQELCVFADGRCWMPSTCTNSWYGVSQPGCPDACDESLWPW